MAKSFYANNLRKKMHIEIACSVAETDSLRATNRNETVKFSLSGHHSPAEPAVPSSRESTRAGPTQQDQQAREGKNSGPNNVIF